MSTIKGKYKDTPASIMFYLLVFVIYCLGFSLSDPLRHLSFFEDLKCVIKSGSFRWLAVASSGYAASVIALSTFGTDLRFFFGF